MGYGTATASGYGSSSGRGPHDGPSATLAGARLPEMAALGIELDASRGPVLGGAVDSLASELYAPPTALADAGLGLRARGELPFHRLLVAADVTAYQNEVRPRTLVAGVSFPAWSTFGGMLALRSGSGCRGGLVLGASDRSRAWGLELRQQQPFRVPWIGRVRFGVQVGTMREAGPGNEWPLFHSMRIEVEPGADWVIGLNRAVVFGGSATDVDVTPRTVGLMFIGLTTVEGKSSSFENQVASVDVRGRFMVGATPMLVTAEYGTDDSGYAFLNVPGFRVTTEWSEAGDAWWGVTALLVTGRTKGYPPWYRHGWFAWGWTDRGHPLGNPLGGQVRALLGTYRREGGFGALDLSAGMVDRGAENLFSPDLEGLGVHGSVGLLWLPDSWELGLSAQADRAGVFAGRWTASVMRRFLGAPPAR